MAEPSLLSKKWADMTPRELYQLEIHYEEHKTRAQGAIDLLRDHMRERKIDLKPIYYGF